MTIYFNDSTELTVNSVKEEKGQLLIIATMTSPEMFRERLIDAFGMKSIRVVDGETEEVYTGYTILDRIELYQDGRLVAYMNREETADMKEAALLVVQMQAQALTDEQALLVPAIYPEWVADGIDYTAGYKVQYKGILYKCLQAHTSQESWTPDAAPSLWAKVLIPDENVIPEWEQPESTNPYNKGDKVTHNGKTWQSTVDGNVWEPGVYGWEEITE